MRTALDQTTARISLLRRCVRDLKKGIEFSIDISERSPSRSRNFKMTLHSGSEIPRSARVDTSHAQRDLQGPTLEQYTQTYRFKQGVAGRVPVLMGEHVTRQHARQQRSSHRAQTPALIHSHWPLSEIPDQARSRLAGLQQQPHGIRMRDRVFLIADLSCTTALLEDLASTSYPRPPSCHLLTTKRLCPWNKPAPHTPQVRSSKTPPPRAKQPPASLACMP